MAHWRASWAWLGSGRGVPNAADDTVAGEVEQAVLMRLDDLAHGGEVFVDERDDLGRAQAFADTGVVAQVAEKHGGDALGAAELGELAALDEGVGQIAAHVEAEGFAQAFAVTEVLSHRVEAVGEKPELVVPAGVNLVMGTSVGDVGGGLENAGERLVELFTHEGGEHEDGDGRDAEDDYAKLDDLPAGLIQSHGEHIYADDTDDGSVF